MATADLGLLGSNSNKTSGTTLAITNSTGALIPAGTLLIMSLTFDNFASLSAPTLSPSNSGGTAWNQRGSTTGSGVTTTAGSGIWGAAFTCLTVSSIAIGATITTITFGNAVVAKVALIEGLSGTNDALRNTVAVGTSGAGTPTATTTGTALVSSDVVIGTAHGENNAAPTGDADTTNGNWSSILNSFTNAAGAATNVTAGIQIKIVTATGAQTYNPTGMAADSVAFVFALTVAAVSLSGNQSDSAPATEAVVGNVSLPRALSNTGAGTDVQARVLSQPRALSDTGAGTDVAARAQSLARAQSDSGAGTDVVASSVTQARALSDSAPATDVTAPVFSRARSQSDSAPATDAVVRAAQSLARSQSETAAATDVTARVLQLGRGLGDAAPAGDGSGGGDEFTAAQGDSAPATDVVTSALQSSRALADTAAATESAEQSLLAGRSQADSAPADDSTLADAAQIARSLADSAPADDSTSGAGQAARSQADSAPADDVNVTVLNINVARLVTDAFTASDAVAALAELTRALRERAPAHSFVVADGGVRSAFGVPVSRPGLTLDLPKSMTRLNQPGSSPGPVRSET